MTVITSSKYKASFELDVVLKSEYGYPYKSVFVMRIFNMRGRRKSISDAGFDQVNFGKRANMLHQDYAYLRIGTILILDEGTHQ